MNKYHTFSTVISVIEDCILDGNAYRSFRQFYFSTEIDWSMVNSDLKEMGFSESEIDTIISEHRPTIDKNGAIEVENCWKLTVKNLLMEVKWKPIIKQSL